MGYQESLEYLLNLSRKELQGLCKSHNLPANRSHVQLAKSLALFFKNKTVLATSSNDRSGSTLKCSFNISSSFESKPRQKNYSQEEATRDHQLEAILGSSESRNYSSEPDSYRLISSIKEMVGDDSAHLQTGNQLEIYNHHEIQISGKACNAAMEVSQYPLMIGATKGYGGSTSESGCVGTKPLDASDVQQHSTVVQPDIVCHNGIKVNEAQKASSPKIYSQNIQDNASTKSGHNVCAITPSREYKIVECSTESGLVSSHGISKKPAPSFQFFVMSEEGINLFIDLNSSLSEWVNDMKDEVRISHKGHHLKSRTTSNHVRILGEVDEHMKIPSVGIGMNLSIDGVERNTGCTNSRCTNSYLNSAVSGNCHFEACIPDPTTVTSSASVLIPNCIPVEDLGSFEGNQLASASCKCYSGGQNQMACDIVSCPKEGTDLSEDLADTSFRMKKSALKFDIPLKSIDNVSVKFPEGIQNPHQMNCHCLKIATVDSGNAGDCLDSKLITVSEKSSLPVRRINENKAEYKNKPESSGIENNGGNCQVSMGHGIGRELSKVAYHQRNSPISHQLDGQLSLNSAATDAIRGATLPDHFTKQQ